MAHHGTEVAAHNHLGDEETSQRLGTAFTDAKVHKASLFPRLLDNLVFVADANWRRGKDNQLLQEKVTREPCVTLKAKNM
jgi:hypothetical protein